MIKKVHMSKKGIMEHQWKFVCFIEFLIFYFSFVIDALQTFLTKPSAILRGFSHYRDAKPNRPKIFVSSDEPGKEEPQAVLLKTNQSSFDVLVEAALKNAVRYAVLF